MQNKVYYTEIVQSKSLATLLNQMVDEYQNRWEIVNVTHVQDGFVMYVTVAVWEDTGPDDD